jgi:glycosyltransferase involved in cell wall biosynthesis
MKNLYYASGLNKGGGLAVLNIFFNKLDKDNFFIIDERIKIKKKVKNIHIVKNNLLSKILSEIKIKKLINNNASIIFLNGLPPFIQYKNQVFVYFQNANILPAKFKDFLSIDFIFSKNFLRFIKFILFKNNCDKWYVFSKFSQKILSRYIPKNKIFIKKINLNIKKKKLIKKYDLIYPASGESHKNHRRLFNALIILSKKGIFPKLVITLNKIELRKFNIGYIKKKYSLKIYNKHSDNRIKFLNLYNQCRALIYPSLSETLGLPLLEAKKFNIDIISSNKEFAKEYSNPKLIFNPNSSISIANKIEQYILKKTLN